MRIALLHNSLDVRGGAEKQLLNLAIELKRLGHKVKIYVSRVDKEKCYGELMEGLDIIECSGYGYGDIKKQIIFSSHYMKKMADRIEPCDIINCHNYPTTYAGIIAKKRLKVPLIWTCNEPPFPPLYDGSTSLFIRLYKIAMSPFLWKNYRQSDEIDKILVLDDMNQKRIENTYYITPEILRSGVDFPKVKDLRLEDRGKSKAIRLFTVSRLDKQRRIDIIIDLGASLKARNIPFSIRIAGDGAERDILEKSSVSVGLSEDIKFLGRISDKELAKEYCNCDVVLFTPENQSWGLVPLEAGYFGRPSIISDGCGVKEVFEHKKDALIFECGNHDDLLDKLNHFIKNKNNIKEVGDEARRLVLNNFSWKRYAKDMEDIFKMDFQPHWSDMYEERCKFDRLMRW